MAAKLSIVGENHYDAQKADLFQPLPWLLIFCIDREQTPAGFNPSGYRPLRPQTDDFLITLLPPSLHHISPSLSLYSASHCYRTDDNAPLPVLLCFIPRLFLHPPSTSSAALSQSAALILIKMHPACSSW